MRTLYEQSDLQKVNMSVAVALCVMMLLLMPVSNVLAYLKEESGGVTNTLDCAPGAIEIEETFNNRTKSDVRITNNSDFQVFVRATVAYYWANSDGSVIPVFDAVESIRSNITAESNGWIEVNGIYYYRMPLDPGATTGNLIDTLTLSEDSVGNTPILDIMAEAMCVIPTTAIESAWEDINIVNGVLEAAQ